MIEKTELAHIPILFLVVTIIILPSGAMESCNPALFNAYNGLDKLGIKMPGIWAIQARV